MSTNLFTRIKSLVKRVYKSEFQNRTPWYRRRLEHEGQPFTIGYSAGTDAALSILPCPMDSSREGAVGDRHYEYAYTVDAIRRYSIPGKALLDVGSSGSFLPGILAALGCNVTCIDARDWKMSWPGLEVKVHDLLSTNEGTLPASSFDCISCISTVEHLGLGRYCDSTDVDGDIKGVAKLRELLKPGGVIILTLPYGRAEVAYPAHRIYDRGRFESLARGMEVLDEAHFGPVEKPGLFRPCTVEEAESITPENGYAVKCCVLRENAGERR